MNYHDTTPVLNLVLEEDTIVVIPGAIYPVLQVDLVHDMRGWRGSVACHLTRSGYDVWHGPFPSREAAVRNAALWGRDMLHARGQDKAAAALVAHFGLPTSRRGVRA